MKDISADAGLALLRTATVGRIAYSDRALPAIAQVAYSVVGDAILIRTAEAPGLYVALLNAVVALQADAADPAGKRWSVTCVGRVRAAQDRLDVLVLEPTMVSGWRVTPAAVLAS